MSTIYAFNARQCFVSALQEYERAQEFEYDFGERFMMHYLGCCLEVLHGIDLIKTHLEENREKEAKQIRDVIRDLNVRQLKSQKSQYQKVLKKYYNGDKDAIDVDELKKYETFFTTNVKVMIELLDDILK